MSDLRGTYVHGEDVKTTSRSKLLAGAIVAVAAIGAAGYVYASSQMHPQPQKQVAMAEPSKAVIPPPAPMESTTPVTTPDRANDVTAPPAAPEPVEQAQPSKASNAPSTEQPRREARVKTQRQAEPAEVPAPQPPDTTNVPAPAPSIQPVQPMTAEPPPAVTPPAVTPEVPQTTQPSTAPDGTTPQ